MSKQQQSQSDKNRSNWILGIFLALIGIIVVSFIASIFMRIKQGTTIQNELTSEEFYKATNAEIKGFFKYESIEDGFSILFPEEPIINKLFFEKTMVKNYTSMTISEDKIDQDSIFPLIQYDVSFTTFTDGKIPSDVVLSGDFMNSYSYGVVEKLEKAKLVSQESTIFKGAIARKYTIIWGTDNICKEIFFVIDGNLVSLSVIYPAGIDESKIHYGDFINSFKLVR